MPVVLTGVNLRPLFSTLPPLVDDVRAELGLSAAAAGLLTTGPVLCLGLLAPLGPRLARRVAVERLLAACGALTAAGLLARGAGGTPALFAGTLLGGAAIAVAQVALPALVRARVPEGTGVLTGAFSMALTLGAALGAFSAVPLQRALGSWQAALAAWALPALVAAAVWLPRHGEPVPASTAAPPWRSRLAWSIAAYFGVQSMAFYASISWLPSILEASGIATGRAGALLGVSNLVQVAPAFAIPVLAARARRLLPLLLAVVGTSLAGVAGVLAAPEAALAWMLVLGIGQGAALGLALILPVLRGRDPHEVASLTAMAMGVGYVVAAAGPGLLGAVRDASGSWTAPLVALLAITALELPLALPAIRTAPRRSSRPVR